MKSTKKIALVTGGNRGLGRDMALNIAQRGNDVIITYNNNKDEANGVVEEIRKLGQKSIALQLNTGKADTFDAFVQTLKASLKSEFGSENFDYLVNNAGHGIVVPSIAATTEQQFDELMNVHFKGVFFLTQKLQPIINDHGGIVNISSGLTRFSQPGSGAYASMKGAIEILTKYMAKEYGSRFIRANIVAPGAIATDFNGGRFRDTQQVQDMVKSITALPRIGQADDIGSVVAFLCSEDARWVNGQRLEASGGMYL
jgi:NAD(P)-dependent dehydrogenase (short-subunit alcohol dehydrogenase family)